MTVQIQFPDGSSRSFDAPVTGLQIAESISNSLRKKSVAIRVNDVLFDLTRNIESDCAIELITRDTDEGLEVIRHDAAHVLAEAVKELFPETQVTIGPAIENGFYYDFVRDDPFTQQDFEKIEDRMKDIVKRNEEIVREVWQRDDAIKYFKSIGEDYKAEIIGDLPDGEAISVYRQGEFLDLCRGPHLPSTGVLGHAFKLTKLAGAYWRGDAKNAQLQRIYGTAWANDQQLKQYLRQLEEAEKRDHRLLGKQLGLFHMQEEAPGMVFWHPKGWSIYQSIKQYMRRAQDSHGYQEINTPQLVDFSLWEKSGHADKFGDDMFSLQVDERNYAIKPMNCPCHVQVFNQGLKSYRELPLRLSEFGSCHRNEMSGALHGIMRVRGFVQDDGHIFCTEGQIQTEVAKFISFLHEVYEDFGFEDVLYKLSTRPENRVGSDEDWDRSEAALAEALDAKGLDWSLQPGEGAFYGPKVEFSLRDCIGRVWQCGTIQVDFSTPGRLDAEYVGEDGNKHVPVMLHRAILGSLERFIGILIEQHSGALPFWLAPVQVVVATIVSDADDYATEVLNKLTAAGIRAELDIRNEKISYKVREHSVQKVPIIAAIGMREAAEGTLAIRRFGSKHQKVLAVDELLAQLAIENTPGHKQVDTSSAEANDQNAAAEG